MELRALPIPCVDLPRGSDAPEVHTLADGTLAWREDLWGTCWGGIAPRKLAWVLGAARSGAGELLTSGPVDSGTLAATALLGARAGVRVHVVVGPPATPSRDSARTAALARVLHTHAEKVWVAETSAQLALAWARAWSGLRVLEGVSPLVVPPGLACVEGALGGVSLGLHIAERVAAGALPRPARVVLPRGSGAAAAGLAVGVRLGGLDAEVLSVRSAEEPVFGRFRRVELGELAQAVIAHLRAAGVSGAAAHARIQEVTARAAASPGATPATPPGQPPLDPASEAAWRSLGALPPLDTLLVCTGNRVPLDEALRGALPDIAPSMRALTA
jgi:1-aminocyclopropane-1-carboxylate deaminase/D-cysteine desulfhydrase-like pyridoxal-dependent ACC family enzyme